MRHRLYNGNLNGKLNHICWDKEIVKTVHPQLRGNCKTNDISEVSIVTIEAHVRTAIPDGQIYNLAQTKWKQQGLEHKWFSHAVYNHATNSIDHR